MAHGPRGVATALDTSSHRAPWVVGRQRTRAQSQGAGLQRGAHSAALGAGGGTPERGQTDESFVVSGNQPGVRHGLLAGRGGV